MAWTPNSPTGTGNIKTDLQNTAENIELLRKNFCSDTAPGNPVKGQIWFKELATGFEICVYDGTNWVLILNEKSFYSVLPVKNVNSDDTVDKNYSVYICDATSNNITITLPSASEYTGYYFTIKRVDNSANLVNITSTDNIDGQSGVLLTGQYDYITVISDGTTWHIISERFSVVS